MRWLVIKVARFLLRGGQAGHRWVADFWALPARLPTVIAGHCQQPPSAVLWTAPQALCNPASTTCSSLVAAEKSGGTDGGMLGMVIAWLIVSAVMMELSAIARLPSPAPPSLAALEAALARAGWLELKGQV